MWKQKWWRSSTTLQNMTCGIALNIGSIVCSCVSSQKGNILKVIIVNFLNLLNRKSYRHSLVFFVSGIVQCSQFECKWTSIIRVFSLFSGICLCVFSDYVPRDGWTLWQANLWKRRWHSMTVLCLHSNKKCYILTYNLQWHVSIIHIQL